MLEKQQAVLRQQQLPCRLGLGGRPFTRQRLRQTLLGLWQCAGQDVGLLHQHRHAITLAKVKRLRPHGQMKGFHPHRIGGQDAIRQLFLIGLVQACSLHQGL